MPDLRFEFIGQSDDIYVNIDSCDLRGFSSTVASCCWTRCEDARGQGGGWERSGRRRSELPHVLQIRPTKHSRWRRRLPPIREVAS
jgi:hypothetical protein